MLDVLILFLPQVEWCGPRSSCWNGWHPISRVDLAGLSSDGATSIGSCTRGQDGWETSSSAPVVQLLYPNDMLCGPLQKQQEHECREIRQILSHRRQVAIGLDQEDPATDAVNHTLDKRKSIDAQQAKWLEELLHKKRRGVRQTLVRKNIRFVIHTYNIA